MMGASARVEAATRMERPQGQAAAMRLVLRRGVAPVMVSPCRHRDGLTSPAANTAWFRPLEFYTEQLRESGFAITSLTEPHPSPEQVRADSWWSKGFTRPLFMLLAAQLWAN